MAELEFGGLKFSGGKMFAVLTALSTLGGAAWGGFEIYKDYMDMKEIIQNIDIDEILAANALQLQKLEDAISYTQDIKVDIKADINRLEVLITAIETAIETDITRNGNALDSEVIQVETDEGSLFPVGGIRMTIRCMYEYQAGTP